MRIDIARIAEGEVLHAGRQRLLARLKCEVQVIGHQAEGKSPVAEAAHTFLDKFIEPCAVLSIEENVLTGITAKEHVVEAAACALRGHTHCGVRSIIVASPLSFSATLLDLTPFFCGPRLCEGPELP